MKDQTRMVDRKKEWTSPQMIVYGDIDSLTQKTFDKTDGDGDDIFQIASDHV